MYQVLCPPVNKEQSEKGLMVKLKRRKCHSASAMCPLIVISRDEVINLHESRGRTSPRAF